MIPSVIDDDLPKFMTPLPSRYSPPPSIANGTPLPSLDMLVSDSDEGAGSQFSLSLRDVQGSQGVFDIFPTAAAGRTPVLVKVTNSCR